MFSYVSAILKILGQGKPQPGHRDAPNFRRHCDADTFETRSEGTGAVLPATHRKTRKGRLVSPEGKARPEPCRLGGERGTGLAETSYGVEKYPDKLLMELRRPSCANLGRRFYPWSMP